MINLIIIKLKINQATSQSSVWVVDAFSLYLGNHFTDFLHLGLLFDVPEDEGLAKEVSLSEFFLIVIGFSVEYWKGHSVL